MMHISENLQQVIYKKVKAFYASEATKLSNTESKDVSLTATFLKDLKVPFIKRITLLLIAHGLLVLYFIKIFRKNSNDKHTLIYSLTKDQIFRDNSLTKIYDFLKTRKINLNEKSKILIECRGILRTRNFLNITVTMDIPLEIFATSLTFKDKIKLLAIFLRRLILLIKSFNTSQYMFLVFKEYIFDENVYKASVHKNQVVRVITGPGNWKYQPIIFEMPELRGKRLMIWYSANSTPIRYKSHENDVSQLEAESFAKDMKIDTHWVWTKQHKDYLKRLTNSQILVKGSMLYYNASLEVSSDKKYDITIFDVTPHEVDLYKNTIYTYHNSKEFIEDILITAEIISTKLKYKISVYIKPKREYHNIHSKKYLSYLKKQINNGRLFELPYDVDLYETILASKVVIGFPFTSPVVIGQELKVPAAHYSSSDILRKYIETDMIQSKHGLQKFLLNNLRG
jgi:polysaccharide biosynthesis PFTS motif protein